MYKNLVKEGYKKEFFKDKDKVLNKYFESLSEGDAEVFRTYNYTNGATVIVDTDSGVAYTKNGFFFSVILKNDNYVNSLDEMACLKTLDESLANQPTEENEG